MKDIALCNATYPNFVAHHNQEVQRISADLNNRPTSMGIKHTA